MRGRIGIYTDQELDTETGLYNYDARLYDPLIGRFISPDSIVPRPYDPQSLNRYSYCRNNPLIYTDPTGHWDDGDNDGDTEAFGGGHDNDAADNDSDVGGDREREGWSYSGEYGWTRLEKVQGWGFARRIDEDGNLVDFELVENTDHYDALLEYTGLLGGIFGVSKKMGDEARSKAFEKAKSRYSKQYEQYNKKTGDQLKKAIRSHNKNITRHEKWVENPKSKVSQWDNLSKQHQENMLHHWNQDIERHKAYKEIAEGILRGRRQ